MMVHALVEKGHDYETIASWTVAQMLWALTKQVMNVGEAAKYKAMIERKKQAWMERELERYGG